MIIDFSINYKSYNKKIVKNTSFVHYTCPKCGAKYGLSFQLIYSFLHGFLSYMNICYLTLRTLLLLKGTTSVSPSTLLTIISRNFTDNDYQQQHTKLNQWPFFMNRLHYPLTRANHIGLYSSHFKSPT